MNRTISNTVVLTIFSTCFYFSAQAQVPEGVGYGLPVMEESEGLTQYGDERILQLKDRYVRSHEGKEEIAGYRIQLFSSSGANSWNKANEVQEEFLTIYPDLPCYIEFLEPSFKVRIGDYRSRLDAERFFVELKENFPDAFIVSTQIKWPELSIEQKEEEEENKPYVYPPDGAPDQPITPGGGEDPRNR
ncbi:SPOR domain-containing protein [bacterium SCSIO 12741]|nr:SPOR domain-containing protein [bacterium SCSIO 12741]